MKRLHWIVSIIISVLSLNAWAASPYQLSTDTFGFGGSEYYEISPDGNSVVYLSNANPFEAHEWYSVPITGGKSVRLSRTAETGEFTAPWIKISPDSRHVLYTVSSSSGFGDMYIVPLSGGASVKLATTGSTLEPYAQFSADSQFVVFNTRPPGSITTTNHLFSIPVVGGMPVQLNSALLEFSEVSGFKISPDSQHVVYKVAQNNAQLTELYSVPVAGGAAIKLNRGPVASNDVAQFKITPDSQRVIYSAIHQTANQQNLHSVPITGGPSLKLNDPLAENQYINAFVIGANNDLVIYSTKQFYPSMGNSSRVFSIDSIPFTGGAKNHLAGPYPVGKAIENFVPSQDGNWIVFTVTEGGYPTPIKLYSVSTAGGEPAKFKFAAPLIEFLISSDSQHIVIKSIETDHKFKLFSATMIGNTIATLIESMYPWAIIWSYAITQNSENVVYIAERDESDPAIEVQGLHITPIAGGAKIQLDHLTQANGENFSALQINKTSSHAVYAKHLSFSGDFRLFAVSFEDINFSNSGDGLCFPVKTSSNKVSLICL